MGPDGTSLTELALITSLFEWTSPTSSLAVNQPLATSETACAMPTTFSRKGEESSEEAIDDVIWGEDLGGVQIFGSPIVLVHIIFQKSQCPTVIWSDCRVFSMPFPRESV